MHTIETMPFEKLLEALKQRPDLEEILRLMTEKAREMER